MLEQEGGNVIAMHFMRDHHQANPVLAAELCFECIAPSLCVEASARCMEGVGKAVMLSHRGQSHTHTHTHTHKHACEHASLLVFVALEVGVLS